MSHVFLLFGASRGIGAACAKALVERGAQVCLTARDSRKLETVRAACGGNTWAKAADITDLEQVQGVVDDVVKTFGRIDTVINFAAYTGPLDAPTWELDPEEWAKTIAANMTGPYNVVRTVLPVMKQQGEGTLFFASSPFGDTTQTGMGGYAASRAGSHAMVRQLSAELKDTKVGAALIYPGMTETEGLTEFRAARGGAAQNIPPVSVEKMSNLFVWAAMQAPWEINGVVLSWNDPQVRAEVTALPPV